MSMSCRAKKVDWKSPIVWMTITTLVLGFYAGGHFMKIGLFLGSAMSLSILILLSKCPMIVKTWAADHPLAADAILSSLATMFVSGFFGTGLTLGIAAVSCGVILSWAIPAITGKFASASL